MHFLTNRKLPRRTFLRGMGATIALPFLESMLPARGSTAAEAKVLPTRFVGAFVPPHGAAPGYWVPESTNAGFKYPFIYEPLEPFRKNVIITSGMWAKSSENPPGVDRRGSLRRRRLPHRREAEKDHRRGYPRRHQHRSGHRAEDRRRLAPAFTRSSA